MKIAVCSDELFPVNEFVISEIEKRGHQAIRYGALVSGQEENWAKVAIEAAKAIANRQCNEGIFFCWSGTGISIAANKVPGIRAALCTDAETARAARTWNHANVLALSNRLLSNDLAKEILTAWFETSADINETSSIASLEAIENAS